MEPEKSVFSIKTSLNELSLIFDPRNNAELI